MSPRSAAPLTLEFVLLGLVAESPAHGYELYQQLQNLPPLSQVWSIGQPQLYALLDKLQRQGLLFGELQPGDRHPDRVQLQLTETGRQRFDAWRTSPVAHARDMRQEFFGKLYFAHHLGGVDALIERQRETCQGWLESLTRQFNELASDRVDERLMFSFRIFQVQALINWLDQAVDWTSHES
jgi:DNA-binding PadR family transcriptional regulator